jgi:hypothetical protein
MRLRARILIDSASHSRQNSSPASDFRTQLLTLSTGVGVGDASASPTAALLLSVLQESMGRIATILFAHKLGTSLEPECKMYRLAADIFNDTAMILDCLSPAFPKAARVLILSFSSVLRSLCGVCAGSAKASLSAHFAKKGNLGELNAVSLCFRCILVCMCERWDIEDWDLHLSFHVRKNLQISFKLIRFAERWEPRDGNITTWDAGESFQAPQMNSTSCGRAQWAE